MNIEIVSNFWAKKGVSVILMASIFISQFLPILIPKAEAAALSAPLDTTVLDPGALGTPCGPGDINCFPQVTSLRPVSTSAGGAGIMQWLELAANGNNTVALRAPDNISSNVLWTLPSATGTVGQVLSLLDGQGNLTWITPVAGSAFASGTAVNNTIRWNGSVWVENSAFTIDGSGNATGTRAALTYNTVSQSTTTNAWVTTLNAANISVTTPPLLI